MGDNIRDAPESKFYEDLKHHVYGYNSIWLEDYFREQDDHQCPLGQQAIKEAHANYFRGKHQN